jgi:chain length determinant protein tyrosine kinase EpsG
MNRPVARADGPAPDLGIPAPDPRELNRAIGTTLVDLGHLTAAQAEQIQRFASERGVLFGDAAVMLNLLQPDDIRAALAQQYNYSLLPRGGQSGVADDVIAAYSPESDGLEPLRALRSQLIFGWLRETARPVLGVVSPEAGDGRSWLIANLGVLFSQAGYRTLVIDADMRRPRQHELFNLDNTAGLSALLAGRAGSEVAFRVHEQLRLFVIPSGLVPPNPQELLARPVFGSLLDHYAKQFDLVVIDTPAIAKSADAQILSGHAGSALMLVRRHHTRNSRLAHAMKAMGVAGAKVIGSIITEH